MSTRTPDNSDDASRAAAVANGGGLALAGSAALVDAHVHLHGCFTLRMFLEHAAANMRRAGHDAYMPDATPGCLMLAERHGERRYEAIRDGVEALPEGWEAYGTHEDESLMLRREGRPTLVLVGGRELVTRQGVELLALGTCEMLENGDSIEATIDHANRLGALVVLPWTVEQCSGARGRAVEKVLGSELAERVYVSDSGTRPRLSPSPWILRWARRRGLAVLAGSDPLPLPEQVSRVGRYGFGISSGFDARLASSSIKTVLAREEGQLWTFGTRERLHTFVWSQTAARLRRWFHGA